MLNFFGSIVDFFQSIWSFLTNLVSSLLTALTLLQQLPLFTTSLLGLVPGVLGSCIAVVVAIGIVKLIVGWGNQ